MRFSRSHLNRAIAGEKPDTGVRTRMMKRAQALLKNDRYPSTRIVLGVAGKLALKFLSERN